MNEKLEALCRQQVKRYPALEATDLVKALYQAEFGCGHLIQDAARAKAWLANEMAGCGLPASGTCPPLTESLGDFSRVHLLPAREMGISVDTLFALFALSARDKAGCMEDFTAQLDQLERMSEAGEVPVPAGAMREYLAEYRRQGCPAARHSAAFREAYAPAYRVIRSQYVPFLPLFAAIDRAMQDKRPVTVAIEGGSASGKSTLGALLAEVYGCTVFHMDDFFLQPHQRTPERFAQPGGNVDYERFLGEVLLPLRQREPFCYRPFSCRSMTLGEAVAVTPTALCIVEGAYSMHPALAAEYDLSAFLRIAPDTQAARILTRNGAEMQRRFLQEWIPLEEKYFSACHVEERCTMVIPVG